MLLVIGPCRPGLVCLDCAFMRIQFQKMSKIGDTLYDLARRPLKLIGQSANGCGLEFRRNQFPGRCSSRFQLPPGTEDNSSLQLARSYN